MNKLNMLLLLDAVEHGNPASVRFERQETGCGTIGDIVNRLILETTSPEDGPNPPSPAEWLGLDYDETRKLFEMHPNASHCPDCELSQAAATLRANFDSYPAATRQRIFADVLVLAFTNNVIDWKLAYLINDAEVSA